MELYNGDCLEVLKSIQDDSVDMVLTDLPYGTTRNAWDSIIPFEPLWAQLKRVTKRGGAIALHADMPFAAKLVCSNLPWYRYELIWEKPLGSDFLNANRKPLKNHESIQIFSECQTKTYNPQFTYGSPYVRTRTSKSLNYGECGSVCTTISEGGDIPKRCCILPQTGKRFTPRKSPWSWKRGLSAPTQIRARPCWTAAWEAAPRAWPASMRAGSLSALRKMQSISALQR